MQAARAHLPPPRLGIVDGGRPGGQRQDGVDRVGIRKMNAHRTCRSLSKDHVDARVSRGRGGRLETKVLARRGLRNRRMLRKGPCRRRRRWAIVAARTSVLRAWECDAMARSRPSSRGSLAATLRAIHERFVSGDVDASYLESTPLRPVVAKSWQRSLAGGVDPDCIAEQAVSDDVSRFRAAHPLSSAMPIIRQLLVEDASESGVVVAVTAADGTLLWVEGDRHS